MSMNRRRWSNELLDSLMEFQNRENSQLVDSLENEKTACTETTTKSEDDQDTNITAMLASLNLQNSPAVSISSKESSEDSYVLDVAISDYANSSERSESPFSVLNLNVTEEVQIKSSENLIRFSVVDDFFADDKVSNINDILNVSMSEDDTIQNTIENQSNKTPVQSDSTILNEIVMEDASSDSGTIKLSSCNSSEQNLTEIRTIENFSHYSKNPTDISTGDLLNFNERITESHTISSGSGTIKVSSCNSSTENIAEKNISEEQCNQITEVCKQDEMRHRFFSSPVELFKDSNTEQLIAEMEMPDVWDALLCLEEALSPFDENKESVYERSLEHGNILTRLSQKFKQTPTRFTEKLVSIIEDSIVSSESPTKQCAGDTSGISLHRMTGEFRKLCKFIEDESMPEWAPSLVNMTTCLEKTESPEDEKNKNSNFVTPKYYKKKNEEKNMETPKNMICCIHDTSSQKYKSKPYDNFVTPKNKNLTPIKQFTPSADKSFEYWESVCNMMCENKASSKKKTRVSLASKKSMEEMLSICERQMASLDDSSIDVRNSEPCKKTDSVIKSELAQVPRSKSVSKMFSNNSEQPKQSSSVKKIEEIILDNDLKACGKNEDPTTIENKVAEDSPKNDTDVKLNEEMDVSDDSYVLFRRKDTNLNDNTFEDGFKPLPCSPMDNSFTGTGSPYVYLEDDQDCSLMIELAKRRQRCLDTAKLMMEIDKEDPNTSGDTTCLETLYKLGINGDKTLAEVEDDAKFLNTLGHCLEYKNYLRDKSKPLKNMLQKFDSPEDFRKKTASALKSKKSLQQKPSSLIKTHQTLKLNKPRIEQRSHLKNVQDRTVTPRIISNTTSKIPPRSETKRPLSSDMQQMKATQRLLTKTTSLNPRSAKTTPKTVPRGTSRISAKTTAPTPKKITPTLSSKPRTTTSAVKSRPQTNRNLAPAKPLTSRTTPTTSPLKMTQLSCRKRITQKTSPLMATQPFSQKNVSTKTSPLKASQPLSQRRITPRATPKLSIPKIVLTPEGESSPVLREKQTRSNVPVTQAAPKLKLFATPGKSPTTVTLGRRKPQSYFSDPKRAATPTTYFSDPKQTSSMPQNPLHSVQSPIGLYIKSTDNDLIQNVQAHTNDWLLTPVRNGEDGKSPQLKIKLSSKENKLPSVYCDENMVLPTVRYHSAKKIHMIDQKSPSLRSLTPNSRIKELLEPIENTVIIRHEARVANDSKASCPDSEMSIHVHKIAEKATSMRRQLM